MSEDFYQQGRAAFQAWMHSRVFAQFDRDAPPLDVMRLFLPPIPQDMMQVARPLPKTYQAWLQGYHDAQEEASEHESLSRPNL